MYRITLFKNVWKILEKEKRKRETEYVTFHEMDCTDYNILNFVFIAQYYE